MKRGSLRKRLAIRTGSPLVAQLKTAAKRDGRPVANFVRKAFADAIAASEAKSGAARP